jgi:hypothetical protein
MSAFRKYWMDESGSEKWAKALDDIGTLKAIEMIFNAGLEAAIKAIEGYSSDGYPEEVMTDEVIELLQSLKVQT